MEKLLVSVIVPIYKVEDYLDQCVQSIVDQTYSNLEIILVDDGSPDQCPYMCDAWAEKDRRIRVIHKENGGLSDARNKGIDISTGDYIIFVDSDDWIKPSMVEILLSTIEKENADICACGIINCYEDREEPWHVEAMSGDSEIILRALYSDTAYPVAAWNKIYRKELWDNFRFPKGKLCEDAFTTYLLLDRAEKIVQISDMLYCYRIRQNSIMTSTFRPARMDEEEAWRANADYMKEHYPEIWKLAYQFYLQRVNVLIHTIDNKNEFNNEYDYLRNVLLKNRNFILFRSSLPIKYRIKFLLDSIQI